MTTISIAHKKLRPSCESHSNQFPQPLRAWNFVFDWWVLYQLIHRCLSVSQNYHQWKWLIRVNTVAPNCEPCFSINCDMLVMQASQLSLRADTFWHQTDDLCCYTYRSDSSMVRPLSFFSHLKKITCEISITWHFHIMVDSMTLCCFPWESYKMVDSWQVRLKGHI